MGLRESLANDLRETLDPALYFERLGWESYPWQVAAIEALKAGSTRIHVVGARQCGKSTVVTGFPAYTSKSEKALSLIYAPSDEQAKDDIERVKEWIARDDSYPDLVLESMEHVRLPNGSLIKANTATEKTKRGKSMPRLLLFEEAAYIKDGLYKTVRPMLTRNPRCVLVAISSPNGKRGFFYKAASNPRWFRIVVKAPWEVRDRRIVPAPPEDAFRAQMAKLGIHGFYSPRHTDRDFMEEELEEHGEAWFRQEYLCEFVDAAGTAFRHTDIERAFGDVAPMRHVIDTEDIPVLEVVG